MVGWDTGSGVVMVGSRGWKVRNFECWILDFECLRDGTADERGFSKEPRCGGLLNRSFGGAQDDKSAGWFRGKRRVLW